jgi:hypothetical protein
MNPYEPPQTIDKALPHGQPPLDPQLGVSQAARRCAWGGKLLLAGAISELVAFVTVNEIQRAKQHGPTNLLNLGGWVFILGGYLLVLLGTITNHRAYSGFVAYLEHPKLVSIFRSCRGLNWLRLAVVVAAIILSIFIRIPEHKILRIAFNTTFMLSFALTYFLHTKAMKIWAQHFPTGLPGLPPLVYWCSGLTVIMIGFGIAAYSFEEQRDPSVVVMIFTVLILALSFAAFADFYARLAKVLAELQDAPAAIENPTNSDST